MVVGDFMSKLKKNCKLNNNSEEIRELEKLGVSDTALVKIKNDAEHTLEVFEGRELPTVGTGSVLASSFGGGALLGLGIGTMTMVAAPLLYFYGSSKLDEAEAALYKAQEHLDEAAVYVEKVKNQCSLFQAVALRANQTDCLLEEIDRNHLNMRVSLLKELAEEKGYDFKKYSDGKRKFVFKTWQVAQAVKIIIDTSLIKEDWNLNPDMEKLLEEGQKLC